MSVRMKRAVFSLLVSLTCVVLAAPSAYAESSRSKARSAKALAKASAKAANKTTRAKASEKRRAAPLAASAHLAAPALEARDGDAEARLIDIYKLIGQANSRDALTKADLNGLIEPFEPGTYNTEATVIVPPANQGLCPTQRAQPNGHPEGGALV